MRRLMSIFQEVTHYDLSNKNHHTQLNLKFNISDLTPWTQLDPTFRLYYIHMRQQRKHEINFLLAINFKRTEIGRFRYIT